MFDSATLLATGGLVAFVATSIAWFRRAQRVAIPNDRTVFLSLWGVGGILGLLSFFVSGGNWLSGIAGGLAAAGSLFLLSLYALRKQGAGQTIPVGQQIPAFEAVDDTGATFTSASLAGSPALVKFFRGHW